MLIQVTYYQILLRYNTLSIKKTISINTFIDSQYFLVIYTYALLLRKRIFL